MAQIPSLSFYPLSTFPLSSPSFPLILLPQSLTATSDASLPPEPKLPLPPHPSLPSSSQMGHPPNKSPNKVRVFASTWNMGGGWAEKELECALQRTGRQKREKGGEQRSILMYRGNENVSSHPASFRTVTLPSTEEGEMEAGGGEGREGGREVPRLLAKWIPLGYDLYVCGPGGREGTKEGGREEVQGAMTASVKRAS